VREVADVVDEDRAALAAGVPGRVEHEVVHDQLPAAVEQVEQRHRAARSVEDVLLVDADHRESASLGAPPVPGAGEVLLLG
jgi:hypothetical protein